MLLTNAWDHSERRAAFSKFNLEEEEFHERHELVISSFERGKIGLDEYLNRTVFYQPRSFSREEFKDFMFSLSQPFAESLEFARSLAKSGNYLMSTLNNESLELNLFRIGKFRLKEIFTLFISSCFVGLRKPEEGIYRLALELTQRPSEECVFIDDRALNLECAAALGMHTIRMQGVPQLRQELQSLGVSAT